MTEDRSTVNTPSGPTNPVSSRVPFPPSASRKSGRMAAAFLRGGFLARRRDARGGARALWFAPALALAFQACAQPRHQIDDVRRLSRLPLLQFRPAPLHLALDHFQQVVA